MVYHNTSDNYSELSDELREDGVEGGPRCLYNLSPEYFSVKKL